MLEVKDLEVSFWGQEKSKVVKGVSFDVHDGEIYGLVGESGSGKSTVLKALTRSLPTPGVITGGDIIYRRSSILNLSVKELRALRGREISRIFQSAMSALNPVTKIGAQLRDAFLASDASADEVEERIERWLKAVELDQRVLKAYPHELSGGMLQRVCIAMAMLRKPQLLLLDEPTTALDTVVQREILDTIFKLCRERKTAALLVSHDLPMVMHYVDRLGVLYQGELVDEGTPLEVFENPKHPHTKALIKASFPDLDSAISSFSYHLAWRDILGPEPAPVTDSRMLCRSLRQRASQSKSLHFLVLRRASLSSPKATNV